MLRVAIVGCGKIADSHVSQILRIAGCEVVGVCDREPLMAQQLCDRFSVRQPFSELKRLLEETRPDVVHITTPPQSHFEIGRECLENGCHIYVEKPFTIDAAGAKELIDIADRVGRRVTVGHDDQFRHGARRMRVLVEKGYLGEGPLHMESYYCYDLGDVSYARALLKDRHHWVRSLPGGLLHNIISHGIARIAEFMSGEGMSIVAHGFVSPMLRKLGESKIVDELRVIISEQARVTAYFTFSSQIRPSLHQFRMYGSKNGLILDQDNETVIRLRGRRYKSVLEQFVPPVVLAGQYLGNLMTNARRFVASDLQSKAGMKVLIRSFYDCIASGGAVPIPYREILVTARIMDEIFDQIRMQVDS